MRLGDGLHHRKADAEPGCCGVEPMRSSLEVVPDAVFVAGGDTRTVVMDLEDDPVAVGPPHDQTPVSSIPDGVADQVRESLT
jgi:hypothetical protein